MAGKFSGLLGSAEYRAALPFSSAARAWGPRLCFTGTARTPFETNRAPEGAPRSCRNDVASAVRDGLFLRHLPIFQILFILVSWLIKILPLGIFGFVTVLCRDLQAGVSLGGLGTYFAAIITANLLQIFVILPAILLVKGISPVKTFRAMLPALTVAFFSKSSAGTLPVTMRCAEENLRVRKSVSGFVLPICTTINMNACAAFILITCVYLMQNAGAEITIGTLASWILIATVAAVGNAGVPMGCFFLAASLLASMNVPILLMGVILPFYAVLDMLETAENVWSDSCVAKMVDKDLYGEPGEP